MSRRPIPIKDRLEKYSVLVNGCLEWTGTRLPLGYGLINVNRKSKLAHRVSYEVFVGPIPEGMQVDHICKNESCINHLHLRIASKKQNSAYRVKSSRGNTSNFKGVSWNKRNKAWIVTAGGKPVGFFKDEVEAARAFNKASVEIYGEFAYLNNI
jgi:hypothetical protein